MISYSSPRQGLVSGRKIIFTTQKYRFTMWLTANRNRGVHFLNTAAFTSKSTVYFTLVSLMGTKASYFADDWVPEIYICSV